MVAEHFMKLKGPPTAKNLGFPNGNEYDFLIRGWTRYWNEIFNPPELLGPDIVKALIASESGFKVKPRRKTKGAMGLMQIMPETLKILGDEKGELPDYLVIVSEESIFDPIANICAGVRWLFQEKNLAKSQFGKEANWMNAVFVYKGAKKNPRVMLPFENYLKELRKK